MKGKDRRKEWKRVRARQRGDTEYSEKELECVMELGLSNYERRSNGIPIA